MGNTNKVYTLHISSRKKSRERKWEAAEEGYRMFCSIRSEEFGTPDIGLQFIFSSILLKSQVGIRYHKGNKELTKILLIHVAIHLNLMIHIPMMKNNLINRFWSASHLFQTQMWAALSKSILHPYLFFTLPTMKYRAETALTHQCRERCSELLEASMAVGHRLPDQLNQLERALHIANIYIRIFARCDIFSSCYTVMYVDLRRRWPQAKEPRETGTQTLLHIFTSCTIILPMREYVTVRFDG